MTTSTPPTELPAGLTLRRADPSEAERIAALGARLFSQAYGRSHPEPELSRYLARAFQASELAAAMAQDEAMVLLIEDTEGTPVGYAQLRPGATLSVVPWSALTGCEIRRFYLDQSWHGRGVGIALMAACLDLARRVGTEVLWLQVWQEAGWATRFYQRAGFEIVGETPFRWAEAVETDWLMARRIAREDTA